MIDEFVAGASHDGATQLLLLGAGYDTRATRLPELAASRVFEVDHPATQARKRQALGSLARSVRYIPLDFECEPLAPALAAGGFDPGRRSCVVWEGVFSYLALGAIDLTLEALVAACAPGSTILLTYVDQRALDDASAGSSVWLSAVRDVGEPFQTRLDPSQAKAFFAPVACACSATSQRRTEHAALASLTRTRYPAFTGWPSSRLIPPACRATTTQRASP